MNTGSEFDLSYIEDVLLHTSAVPYYTEGACWALATAFDILYGFPVVFIESVNREAAHILSVQRGKLVDIRGKCHPATAKKEWMDELGGAIHYRNVGNIADAHYDFWSHEGWIDYIEYDGEIELALDVARELGNQMNLTPKRK